MSRRITLTGRGTFNAAGMATAVSSTVPVGEIWRMTSTSVKTTSVAVTEVTTYRGPATPANRLDVSKRRGNGASSDTRFEMRAGEFMTVVWTGGDVGASADFTAVGELDR